MISKRIAVAIMIAVSGILSAVAPVMPQSTPSPPAVSESAVALSPSERRGLRFLRLNCARCHAVEKVGQSPLATAPALRTLHLKYPVSDLQRPLSQGVHPIMPRFQIEPSQVDDILTYLKTLER